VDFLFLVKPKSLNATAAHIHKLQKVLSPLRLSFECEANEIKLTKGSLSLRVCIITDLCFPSPIKGTLSLPLDYLVRQPQKVGAIIQSKLGLNTRVFARKCELRKIKKEEAIAFLNTYHLMNSTQSAYNYGLFHNAELLAVSSFSKGRKMHRLQDTQRSYELIRFCCKGGYTITGGLSKLMKHFVFEKKAGDIMTYVDQHWSEGDAFVKAGFKRHGKTEPKVFLIHKKTFERKTLEGEAQTVDLKHYFLLKDCGNLKMIYTPVGKT
jgi:hypothetical protein